MHGLSALRLVKKNLKGFLVLTKFKGSSRNFHFFNFTFSLGLVIVGLREGQAKICNVKMIKQNCLEVPFSFPLDMTGSRQQAASCNRHQAQTIVSSPLDMTGSRQQVASCSRHQAKTTVSSSRDMTGNREQAASCSRHQA